MSKKEAEDDKMSLSKKYSVLNESNQIEHIDHDEYVILPKRIKNKK